MATQLDPDERRISYIVQSVRELLFGRDDAHGVVTLRPNQTTTTVSHPNCSVEGQVLLTAKTANAAAALATTYVSSIVQGAFTLTHASNAQADKTFAFSVRGG